MNQTIKHMRKSVAAVRDSLRQLQMEDLRLFTTFDKPFNIMDPDALDTSFVVHNLSHVLMKTNTLVLLHNGKILAGLFQNYGKVCAFCNGGGIGEDVENLCAEDVDAIWAVTENIKRLMADGAISCDDRHPNTFDPDDDPDVMEFDYRLHTAEEFENDLPLLNEVMPNDDHYQRYSIVFVTQENAEEMAAEGWTLRNSLPSELPFHLPEGLSEESLIGVKMIENGGGHWAYFEPEKDDLAWRHPSRVEVIGKKGIFLPVEN